jgi:CubicO group peptidase (beta-lactamase class C family)
MIRSFTRQAAVIIRKAGSSYYSGSVLIAYQGRVLLHQGYGWADPQKTHPITPHTRFWIASISKQFTAAAIFRLVEQGRLLLKDPLNHFFPTAAADKKTITLQQLLTHTAGLRQNYAADGLTERQAAIDAILAGPLKSPPGECFGYSNDAYNLLAAIVEISAGDPFETSLQRLVLDPAGLADTGFWGMEGHNKVAEIHGEVDEIVRQPNWGRDVLHYRRSVSLAPGFAARPGTHLCQPSETARSTDNIRRYGASRVWLVLYMHTA